MSHLILDIIRSNIEGAGWGFAICWPLLTVQAAWLEIVWLGGLGILLCVVFLLRELTRDDLAPQQLACGSRCCVVAQIEPGTDSVFEPACDDCDWTEVRSMDGYVMRYRNPCWAHAVPRP